MIIKQKTKVISVILVLCLLFSFFPTSEYTYAETLSTVIKTGDFDIKITDGNNNDIQVTKGWGL